MGCLKLEEKSKALRVVYRKDTAQMLTQRGYTGHEHFFEQDIIHMNGRIYDPKLRMFLSPDINLLDPTNSQHYNRYSYGLNNPLKYIDPSGNEIITLAALGTAALVGAIIGGISYTALACYYGNFTWNNLAKNVVTSAVTSAVMATGMGILKDLFLFPQGGATALSRANETMSNGVSNFLGDTGHSIAQAGTQGAAFTGYTAASIMNNSINTSASFASYSNNANLFNASNYYNNPPGNSVSRGFDFGGDQLKNPPKTYEEILRSRLQKTPNGGKISGSELDFLNMKLVSPSKLINSLERLSATEFKVNPTFGGKVFGISSDAQLTITPDNLKIAGKMEKVVKVHYKGINSRHLKFKGNNMYINNNRSYFYEIKDPNLYYYGK